MQEKYNNKLAIVAGSDHVAGATHILRHGDILRIADMEIRALATPCHTLDSICFYTMSTSNRDEYVFTGDTLFTGGCGKFFEGNGQQMYHALHSVLNSLPVNVKVYPGHEYTVPNLLFAKSIEPNNQAIHVSKWQKRRGGKNSDVGSTVKYL